MSGDELFFARWSRRKQAVAARLDAEENPPPSAAESAKPVSPTAGEAPPATPLPSIELIESASDIKAFLAPGVPLELTRAALRRAWAADPAIRDFIGLSENAWDFTALGGVPGFGSLGAEDALRLVAQVLSEPQAADPGRAAVADGSTTAAEPPQTIPIAGPAESIAAAQHEDDERKARESRPHRRHGGALPQ